MDAVVLRPLTHPFHIQLEQAGHKLIRDETGDVDIFICDFDAHNGPGCELCGGAVNRGVTIAAGPLIHVTTAKVRRTMAFTGPPPKRPPLSKRGIGGSRAIFCSLAIYRNGKC